MRNISVVMLIVAVILGGLTVFAARSFIQNQRSTQVVPSEQTASMETTTIIVATVPLKFGDEITHDHLKEVEWPADLMPEGAFETIAAVVGDERRVTLRSININEPVVKNKISGFGYRATLSQIIGEGNRAVTIRVNDVASVGGFVLPGDEVDVVLSYQNGKDILDSISKVIIQNVRVLAIDQISDESQEGAIVGKAATIEVTPEDSQKIALASTIGTLSLALRRLSEEDTDPDALTKTIAVSDLKPAGLAPKTVAKTSYRRAYTAPVKAAPTSSTMTITRGTEQSETNVDIADAQVLAGGELGQFTSAVSKGVSKTTKTITSATSR